MMTRAEEKAFQRKFTGNSLNAQYLATRRKSFLNKNIARVAEAGRRTSPSLDTKLKIQSMGQNISSFGSASEPPINNRRPSQAGRRSQPLRRRVLTKNEPLIKAKWMFGPHFISKASAEEEETHPCQIDIIGAKCALCNFKDLKSYDILYLHLSTSHGDHKFNVTNSVLAKDAGGRPTTIELTIIVDIEDTYRPSKETERKKNAVPAERLLKWISPSALPIGRKSFDLEKYVGGDYSWTQAGGLGENKIPMQLTTFADVSKGSDVRSKAGGIARKTYQTGSQLHFVNGSRVKRIGHRRPFDSSAVKDLPPPKTRTYEVPVQPQGRTLFTSSRRPLTPGMKITNFEAADESKTTPNEWFIHKHNEEIDSFVDFSDHEKSFLRLWDNYLLTSNEGEFPFHLAGEVLIRFIRIHKHHFDAADVNEFGTTPKRENLAAERERIRAERLIELAKFTTVLMTRGVIGSDVFKAALEEAKGCKAGEAGWTKNRFKGSGEIYGE